MTARKKILNLVAFFTAAATAVPLSAAEKNYLEDNNGNSVTVVEYSQTEAKEDFAKASSLLNPYLSPEDKKTELSKLYSAEVFAKLQSLDLHGFYLMQFSQLVARQYMGPGNYDHKVSRLTDGGGPYALRPLSNGTMKKVGLPDEKVCFLHTVDKKDFKYGDWYELQTQRKMLDDADFPEKFGAFQQEMVDFHERAHCLGASEPQADFLATLQMKRKYEGTPDADGVNSYLYTHKMMRLYFLKIGTNPAYKFCGPAVQSALDFYESNKDQLRTEKDIWTIATTHSYPKANYSVERFKDDLNFSGYYIHQTSRAITPKPGA